MTFDKNLTVDTPEGLRIETTIAGVGSRIAAQVIDAGIKALVTWGVLRATGVFNRLDVAFGALVVLYFIWLVWYELIFEMAWSGRTPGKRMLGLRVMDASGAPAAASSLGVRNIFRVLDGFAFYAIGLVSAIVTSNNQRLGDLAAGTVVVRERTAADKVNPTPNIPEVRLPEGVTIGTIDGELLAAARAFLGRRDSLERIARARVARSIATPMRNAVSAPGVLFPDERVIEIAVAVTSRR